MTYRICVRSKTSVSPSLGDSQRSYTSYLIPPSDAGKKLSSISAPTSSADEGTCFCISRSRIPGTPVNQIHYFIRLINVPSAHPTSRIFSPSLSSGTGAKTILFLRTWLIQVCCFWRRSTSLLMIKGYWGLSFIVIFKRNLRERARNNNRSSKVGAGLDR